MPNIISNTVQVHVAAYDEEEKEYKYLLLKRQDDDITYPSIWQAITGTIEEDEKAYETALRELREETSLKPLKGWAIPYITTFYNIFNDEINASPVFGFITDYVKEVNISEEHQDFNWFDFEECSQKLILPTHRDGLRTFRDYILIPEFGDVYKIADELIK